MCGNDNTYRATLDEVVYHCKAVSRGAQSSFIVADMPFGSYEISTEDAVRNAIRLVKEGNANAVKLEGGKKMAPKVKAIVEIGIPVMGHIGLTPQSFNALGGYRVQGRTAEAAMDLVKDARALERAGCYSLVIESVPQKIAEIITNIITIPTIGIGAGNRTSGQILVWHDMFGLFQDFTPKFCKQYANLGKLISEGLAQYKSDCESRSFPTKEYTYTLKQEEWEKFKVLVNRHPSQIFPENLFNSEPAESKINTPLEENKIQAKKIDPVTKIPPPPLPPSSLPPSSSSVSSSTYPSPDPVI
jgi:3-methyl-2-oxobutanoate hydroxymethyltransferase